MTYDELVEEYGNASQAASALGFSRQALSRWKTAGIPFESQFRIQMKTRGRLKANLPAERKTKVAA